MSRAVALSLAGLDALPPAVSRPHYRRQTLRAGIVHLGVGNFHRAHMARYLDDLMEAGEALDWAIIGAGVTPHDRATRERLQGQDWLTTVVERDAARAWARVTGPMVDFVDPADVPALVARLADPAIRIVSLTVTEGGYFLDAAGRVDRGREAIRRDAATPDRPATVFGLILAGLARRRAAGTAPFTVLSCDNLPHNGDVTRRVVTDLAALSNPGLASWVQRQVAFPNGMVDRITPATGDRAREILVRDFGVRDAAPVFCEPFRQWVLEDRFPAGRPPLEDVGVTFVDDVGPWELMKIRILNGGHATLCYPAALLGLNHVDEAMRHELVERFLAKVTREEILPHVPPVPGVDLERYRAEVARRFANPTIGDTLRRICFDGSSRQPKFIVPSIAAALRVGAPIAGLALVSALWCRYCLGITEHGEPIPDNDPSWPRLQATARATCHDPGAWLAQREVYGEIGTDARFSAAFAAAFATVREHGTAAALRAYLAA